jgi:cytochrome c peroxidase
MIPKIANIMQQILLSSSTTGMPCKRLNFVCGAAIIFFGCLQLVALPQLTSEEQLGHDLFFDENLSLKRNQSCASCHDPAAGFADPKNLKEPVKRPVSEGSILGQFGNRNTPSAAYAAFSPFFHWDGIEGHYVGGQFWDGRANTLAEQAALPFFNPVEMALPDILGKTELVKRLAQNPKYQEMFIDLYDIDLKDLDYAGNGPAKDAPGVNECFQLIIKAISAFEQSRAFTAFDSKYDYFLAGKTQLSAQEWQGLQLFEGKALCSECHISQATIAPDMSSLPPLFTDFTYDNLGIPANPQIGVLGAEAQPIDFGLGGRPDIKAKDPEGLQLGKFKVPTLRNVALTAPYGHNGLFSNLEQIVHFYNTRDALPSCADSSHPGFGVTHWPVPEVQQNVNKDELGDLKLTPEEEKAIVAFMLTLTDGWGNKHNMPPLPRPTLPPIP